MAIRFLFLTVGALALATTTHATGTSDPNKDKCFTNNQTSVRVCCAGEVPALLYPTILWKMLPEMCNDTSCTTKQSHEAYIGGGSHVVDSVTATKSNFSSKSDRDDLVNTFLKASGSGLVMAWTGPSQPWTGGAPGFYTFGTCDLRSTKTSASISLQRGFGQSL